MWVTMYLNLNKTNIWICSYYFGQNTCIVALIAFKLKTELVISLVYENYRDKHL